MYKYTLRKVKKITKEIAPGFQCISNEYLGVKEKLLFKCPEKHTFSMTWDSFNNGGRRCKKCHFEKLSKKLKFSITDIKDKIKIIAPEYKLISTIYKNSCEKLTFRCDKGHIYTASWNEFNACNRCPECAKENRAKKARLKFEYVKNKIEKEGYVLNSTAYINNSTKLSVTCPEQHTYLVAYGKWQQGRRCPICQNRIKKPFKYVKDYIEKEGYTLIAKYYVNANTPITIKCPRGHIYNVSFSNFSSGCRCKKCYHENNTGENNCAWKGGMSAEPYCAIWIKSGFKENIRERDNHQCQNPYCHKKPDLHKGKTRKPSIHHIDHNKKNCHPSNLITVCGSCNTRAEGSKKGNSLEWWEEFYKNIMRERFMPDGMTPRQKTSANQ